MNSLLTPFTSLLLMVSMGSAISHLPKKDVSERKLCGCRTVGNLVVG